MLGIASALLFALLMGVASVFTRRGLEHGSFLTLLFVSLAIGTPFFVGLSLVTGAFASVPVMGVVYAAAGAVLGSIVGRSLYFIGIGYLGPGKSLSITATSPLYAAVLAWAILDEQITVLVILGTLGIVFGIVGLSRDVRAETDRSGNSLWVMLYPATNAVTAAMAVTIRKLALNVGVSPIEAGTINFIVGFLLVAPVFAFYSHRNGHRIDFRALRNFTVASTVMAVGFVFYFVGLRLANASIFFPLVQTQPFFAVGLSALFLRELEIVTRWTMLGAVSIVTGATLVVVG